MIKFQFLQKDIYYCIFFLSHDVLPFLNQKYLSISISDTFDITLIILDIHIFMEKRINLGFFGLRHDLCCNSIIQVFLIPIWRCVFSSYLKYSMRLRS